MEPEDMPITNVAEAEAFIGAVYVRQWMKTADGVEIKPGLMVFTYDYKWGIVDKVDFEFQMERNKEYVLDRGHTLTSSDFWFDVTYPDGSKGWFNGERMTTTCPRCRRGYDNCCMNREKSSS